jgi:hypothetical protein
MAPPSTPVPPVTTAVLSLKPNSEEFPVCIAVKHESLDLEGAFAWETGTYSIRRTLAADRVGQLRTEQ